MAAAAKGIKPRELKRLEKELADIQAAANAASSEGSTEANNSKVSAEAVGGDLTKWKGTLYGPIDTVYEGGTFEIDIEIPGDYPYNPPKMKFTTKIWHPNVSSQTGAICLDVLGKEWSPALTIRTALLSIQALLSTPEPTDPQDAEVAEMYKNNKTEFDQTARFWTDTYAKAQPSGNDSVMQIVEMGFDEAAAKQALEKHGGDVTAAINSLFG